MEREISNRFVRACAEGRIEDVRKFLAQGEDVNQIDEGILYDGMASPDSNQPNSFSANGLMMAMQTHNLPIVKLLMEAGADPYYTAVPKRHPSPVETAVLYGFTDGLRYVFDVCDYPVKPPLPSAPAHEMLIEAMRNARYAGEKCLDVIRYLVEEKGLDPFYVSRTRGCMLTAAAQAGVPASVTAYFLKKGVKPDRNYIMPAPGAARAFRIATLHDMNPELTPLQIAVCTGATDKVRLLLQYGADPLRVTRDGKTITDYMRPADKAGTSEMGRLLDTAVKRRYLRVSTPDGFLRPL